MGEEALISQLKGNGHKRRVKDAAEAQSFFAKSGIKKSRAKMADGSVQSSTSTSASQSCDNSVSDTNQSTSSASGEKDCSSKRTPKLQTTIDCNIISSEALEAEIIRTISSACKGYSNNSAKVLNLILKKMFERSPLGSVVIRNATVVNPTSMQITKDSTLHKKLRELFQHFVSLKLLFAPTADQAFTQVKKVSAEDVDNIDKLDNFFFKKCNVSKFPELSSVLKIVLTMSQHGQAYVGRGFSLQKKKFFAK